MTAPRTLLTIVSPHRDDAAYSAGLTLLLLAARGVPLRVVNCFTRSDYAPERPELQTADAVTRARAAEDARFLASLGSRAGQRDLALRDAPLRPGYGDDEAAYFDRRSIAGGDAALHEELERELAALRVAAPGPWLLPLSVGDHIDHRLALAAGLAGVGDAPIACYEDLPYAVGRPDDVFQLAAEAVERELAPLVVRSPSELHAKYRALLCYRSQCDPALAAQILGHANRYGKGERLWADAAFASWLRATLPDAVA